MPSSQHFIGRAKDLQLLWQHLDVATIDGRGRLVTIRGRRQAGKSRLVTEFTDRTRLPQLEARPVLVILIGSDISTMEALSTYERPLFGRVKEMAVNPFGLGDTAQMIAAADPAVAIDAQLVTGGYPPRVADSYLRFWLRFIGPSLPDIARGRPDLALANVTASWTDYRGMAVEPLVRDCVERIAGTDPELDGVGVVGGYWTRTNDLEVDLVGVDRWPDAQTIGMVGSIKWRAQRPFDQHDFTELAQAARRVPGASDVKLVAASRMGCTAAGLDCVYGPADLVSALH